MALALVPLVKPQDTHPLDISLKSRPYLRKLLRDTYDGLKEPDLPRIAEVPRMHIPPPPPCHSIKTFPNPPGVISPLLPLH